MEWQEEFDRQLESAFKNPLFLGLAGTLLNLNSSRKMWMNQTLIQSWKILQLPNKRDQERTLHLIQELYHRIAELEGKLQDFQSIPRAEPRSRSSEAGSRRVKVLAND